MIIPQNALFLIGSAKPAGGSTSEALATYLAQRLEQQGVATAIMHVARAMRTEARVQDLLQAVEAADLLVLAFPLYVDTLPYLATGALERIAAHRQAQPSPRLAAFLAIANCGFPEAEHNATALAICQQFAHVAGFAWAGGLALGAGGAINGRPLAQAGGMARHVVRALDITADALAAGQPAPVEAFALLAQPLMPPRAYTFLGDLGWRMQARRHGAYRRLRARPFPPRTPLASNPRTSSLAE